MRSFNTRRRVTTGAVDKKDKPTNSGIMRRSSTASSDSTPIDDTFRNEVELEYRYGSVRRFFGFRGGITSLSSPREHNGSSSSSSNLLLLIKLFAVIFVIVACSIEVVSHLHSQEVQSPHGGDYGGNGSYIDMDENDDFYSDTFIAKDEEINVVPKKSTNQQPEESLIAQQFGVDPFKDRDKFEMIQNGEMNFAGIRYSSTSFEEDRSSKYSDVFAEFCVFNQQLNKSDPSYYSKSKHIIAESTHCGEHRFSISMSELMEIKIGDDIKELPLSGMLFHQGYSGGGLISNALTAFDNVYVVSEHTALHAVLNACSYIHNRYQSDNCSSSKQRQLVQDVIKLLSRTTDMKMDHLFLKFESASSAYIPMLHSLYPDVKWTFSYRDAEEVLAKNMQRKRNISCIKTKSSPSTALSNKADEKNINLQDLSSHEICALHLSTLLEAAIKEHNESGTGMLVSYTDIITSDVIVDKVIPYFDLELDATTRDKVKEILAIRSNTRGKKANDKTWNKTQEDNIEVSKEVHEAVATYMSGVVDGWDDEM